MKWTISIFILLTLGYSCTEVKQVGLYDEKQNDQAPDINGFYSLNIFSDQITSDVWFTQAAQCLQIHSESKESKKGSGAISIEWNKQADNCGWLGMGIGWDNWSGKNLETITQSAALSFWVKMKKGQSKGLPWAVGFEDFSGGQAWTGITAECVPGGTIVEDWTQVIIPLDNFPFEGMDVDVTSIKQIIFQFESSGKVWVDDISFVPYTPKGQNAVTIKQGQAPVIDGQLTEVEWKSNPVVMETGLVNLNWDQKFLYISANIKDESPLQNKQQAEKIWNGDAIELAFSTASDVDPKRKIFYNTDHHIGIKMGDNPIIYDWSQEKTLSNVEVKVQKTKEGYIMEASVPWSEMGAQYWKNNQNYSFELAIDAGNASGSRTVQYHWNSSGKEGFNFNPSLWGMISTQP